MPHLTLEYTEPLPVPVDTRAVLAALHAEFAGLGLFVPQEIKSRAVPQGCTYVGLGVPESVFVHLSVAILAGRPLEVRQRITEAGLAVLRSHFRPIYERYPCDLTVEVREMDRGTYGKAMNALASVPPRPSGDA